MAFLFITGSNEAHNKWSPTKWHLLVSESSTDNIRILFYFCLINTATVIFVINSIGFQGHLKRNTHFLYWKILKEKNITPKRRVSFWPPTKENAANILQSCRSVSLVMYLKHCGDDVFYVHTFGLKQKKKSMLLLNIRYKEQVQQSKRGQVSQYVFYTV